MKFKILDYLKGFIKASNFSELGKQFDTELSFETFLNEYINDGAQRFLQLDWLSLFLVKLVVGVDVEPVINPNLDTALFSQVDHFLGESHWLEVVKQEQGGCQSFL